LLGNAQALFLAKGFNINGTRHAVALVWNVMRTIIVPVAGKSIACQQKTCPLA
jgi:hypothetical protein